MSPILIAAAVIVLYFAIEGFRQGVVRRVIEIVGLLLVFLFASRFSELLEPRLVGWFDLSSRVAFFSSWAVVLVAGTIGVRLLARAAGKLFSFSLLAWVDRGGGLVLGGAFGVVLVSCLLILALAIPLGDGVHDGIRDDRTARSLLYVAPSVYDTVCGIWKGDRFSDIVDRHLEPRAKKIMEEIRAAWDGDDPPS